MCSFGSPILWPTQQQQLCPGIVLLCHHHPVMGYHGVYCYNQSGNQRHALCLWKDKQCFLRDDTREEMRKQSQNTARCSFMRSSTSLGFSLSLFLPSTYLPETPFPGRWPSQFASSLSKHFTGERLDLHPPIASHHMRTHTHTHT